MCIRDRLGPTWRAAGHDPALPAPRGRLRRSQFRWQPATAGDGPGTDLVPDRARRRGLCGAGAEALRTELQVPEALAPPIQPVAIREPQAHVGDAGVVVAGQAGVAEVDPAEFGGEAVGGLPAEGQ